jgi:hypothetical protein
VACKQMRRTFQLISMGGYFSNCKDPWSEVVVIFIFQHNSTKKQNNWIKIKWFVSFSFLIGLIDKIICKIIWLHFQTCSRLILVRWDCLMVRSINNGGFLVWQIKLENYDTGKDWSWDVSIFCSRNSFYILVLDLN